MPGVNKVEEALAVLRALGLPRGQINERSALTLRALAGLCPADPWSASGRRPLRIWDIMGFMNVAY